MTKQNAIILDDVEEYTGIEGNLLAEIEPKKEESAIQIKNPQPFIKIQGILDDFNTQRAGILSTFEEAALTVNSYEAIVSILDDRIINKLKKLQNTQLGFLTDRPGGYDNETTRNCLIVAALNGLKLAGNEFNILSGKCYITKSGYKGLIFRNPDFTNVVIDMGIPEVQNMAKKAIVTVNASWTYKGKKHKVTRKISIRMNSGMSDDAILGKAERKIRQHIWESSMDSRLDGSEIIATVES